MTKFYGNIGFLETKENPPGSGIWEPVTTVRPYYGDVTRNQRRYQENSQSINDNLNISNEISILGDPYAYENFNSMRWVEYGGAKWKISWINIEYPRIILTLSGVYNDFDEDDSSGDSSELPNGS